MVQNFKCLYNNRSIIFIICVFFFYFLGKSPEWMNGLQPKKQEDPKRKGIHGRWKRNRMKKCKEASCRGSPDVSSSFSCTAKRMVVVFVFVCQMLAAEAVPGRKTWPHEAKRSARRTSRGSALAPRDRRARPVRSASRASGSSRMMVGGVVLGWTEEKTPRKGGKEN